MSRNGLTEDTRYNLYRYGAHAAWWTAFAWTALLTYVNLTHPPTAPPGAFQRVSGLGIILLMGIAIALGSALSRMRLASVINKVFESGMRIADERQEEMKEWTVKKMPVKGGDEPPSNSSIT